MRENALLFNASRSKGSHIDREALMNLITGSSDDTYETMAVL